MISGKSKADLNELRAYNYKPDKRHIEKYDHRMDCIKYFITDWWAGIIKERLENSDENNLRS